MLKEKALWVAEAAAKENREREREDALQLAEWAADHLVRHLADHLGLVEPEQPTISERDGHIVITLADLMFVAKQFRNDDRAIYLADVCPHCGRFLVDTVPLTYPNLADIGRRLQAFPWWHYCPGLPAQYTLSVSVQYNDAPSHTLYFASPHGEVIKYASRADAACAAKTALSNPAILTVTEEGNVMAVPLHRVRTIDIVETPLFPTLT